MGPKGPEVWAQAPRSSSIDMIPTRTKSTNWRSCNAVICSDCVSMISIEASMMSALVEEAVMLEVIIFFDVGGRPFGRPLIIPHHR